ncbi:MAG: hypothetical protein JXA25_18310 [Anaerolineales bacterium]|nr:hypothetical protein [Anaerolineales bacterium]
METSGIQPVLPQQRVNDPSHALRVNQRISAEILKVAADHVVLALDGFPVIAQLTSPDQTAELADRKNAQFLVKDSSGKQLLLQLVPEESARSTASTSETALIAKLLNHLGIPMENSNLILAQQLIEAGIPITPPALAVLRKLLDQTGPWEQQQAHSAVQLLKAGIPLTLKTLNLALAEHPGIIPALQELFARLQIFETVQTSPWLKSSVQKVLQFLNQILSTDNSTSADPKAMAFLVNNLGSTLENHLLKLLSQPDAANTDPLFQLLALRSQLQAANHTALTDLIDRVLTELEFQGLQNLPPADQHQEGDWFTVDLPFLVSQTQAQQHQRMKTVRLRIAYQQENGEAVIDPASTHLKLHFPIGAYRELTFDLILTEESVAARINASDEELQGYAEQELPDLKSKLEALGYHIQRVECMVSTGNDILNTLQPPVASLPDRAINVEA